MTAFFVPAVHAESSSDEVLGIAKSMSSPDAREFEAIDRESRARNHDEVLKRTQRFIKSFPESRFLSRVYHFRALAFLGKRTFNEAVVVLGKAVQQIRAHSQSGDDALLDMIHYNAAYAQYELGHAELAAKEIGEIDKSRLDPANLQRMNTLRAKVARLAGDHNGAARAILDAVQKSPDSSGLAPMASFLDEELDALASNADVIESIASDYSSSPLADRLFFRAANLALKRGARPRAESWFGKIVDRFPSSQYVQIAKSNLTIREQLGKIDSRKIGVVLTLSGKFGKIGARALQGMELAFGVFKNDKDLDTPALVVMDDQGDPDRAIHAMEELAFKHGVVAIIGPISSKLLEPMAHKARELQIPLLSLTQKDVPLESTEDWFFNAGVTATSQVHQLVKYAREKLHATDFALLAPANKFGEEYTKTFWDELDASGATVRGYETYPDQETDFRLYIDRLVGLNATDARSKEVDELKALKAVIPIKKKSKKLDRLFNLKPIVDFQVVFVPDEPRALGQILPTFAYRDVDKIVFLGTNTWNSQELVARAGRFAEGSIFVDGFHLRSPRPTVQKYIEEFRKTFAMEPSAIDATAYDAARILESLIGKSASLSRSDLRSRLSSLKDFQGLSGTVFAENGRIIKTLHLLTLKSGKIEEIAF